MAEPRFNVLWLQSGGCGGCSMSLLCSGAQDVLGLLAQGVRIADIGVTLGISRHTVGDHVKNIYRKLNITSRAEAALQARHLGLI